MSYRKFKDRSGSIWEVRDESLSRWVFQPVPGNDSQPRTATPPGYTDDPFEMSESELQRLLDGARSTGGPSEADWPFTEPPP